MIDLSRRDVLRSMAGLGVVTLTGGAGTLLGACTAARSGAIRATLARVASFMTRCDNLLTPRKRQ